MDYFSMYRDVWEFHKKHIENIQDTDEFWEMVVNEGNAISKKYNECKFIINLVLGEITEFERIYKEMKANADTAV